MTDRVVDLSKASITSSRNHAVFTTLRGFNELGLHFFFAERHTAESSFAIETNVAEPGSCE